MSHLQRDSKKLPRSSKRSRESSQTSSSRAWTTGFSSGKQCSEATSKRVSASWTSCTLNYSITIATCTSISNSSISLNSSGRRHTNCSMAQLLTHSLHFRNGKIEDALTFAQNKISEAGETNPEVLNELERTLALLAFEKPTQSPFSDLLDQTHRQKIASELNAAILRIEHKQNQNPRMMNVLKLILWAQSELDKRNVGYSRMTDLSTAKFDSKN